MKTKETQSRELATGSTGLRPGDFPLGSVKSRAVARALVSARKPKLTVVDLECLAIVRMTEYLRAGAWPSYREMEKLSVWQRGWALFQASEGYQEYVKAIRELAAGRPFSLSAFARMNGWTPSDGDIWRWMENNPPVTAERVEGWRSIWKRLVLEFPFPFKFEAGILYARVADYVLANPLAYGETGTGALKGFQPVWPHGDRSIYQ
jgi:hypothetical protein